MKAMLIAIALAAILFVSGCSSKTETSGGSGTLQKTSGETPTALPDQPDNLDSQLDEADQLYQNSGDLDYLEEDLNTISNI